MVPEDALQDRPGVGDFADQNELCHSSGKLRRIGPPVLLASQQDIAGDGTLHPRQESSVFGQEAHADIVFSAKAHEKGAAHHPAKADDAAQGVHRHLEALFTLHGNQHGFTLLGEVGALGGYIQSVEVLLHTPS